MSDSLSVGQLQRKAKNALAREFRGQVWVTGEVKSIRDHRGNLYLTLIEPGDYSDGSDTSLDVAAWSRRAAVIRAQLSTAGLTLAAGMQVRISGNVTLSKLGRLMVELSALDVEALLGNQAAEKRRLYAALEAEGLLRANKALPMPLVPLRVGLVTSENSEGCNDFLGQLERSQFPFVVTLSHSPVQGPAAPPALARAICGLYKSDVDVIAVVRGGGGELDAFDKEPVARAITGAPVPVLTGIGHTGDHSVADDVAKSAFVTPTECGQALVVALNNFDQRLTAASQRLHTSATRAVDIADNELRHRSQTLARSAQRNVDSTVDTLRVCSQRLATATLTFTDAQSTKFEYMLRHINALNPRKPLERGYSLTHNSQGELVYDATKLSVGDEIISEFFNGRVRSEIKHQEAK